VPQGRAAGKKVSRGAVSAVVVAGLSAEGEGRSGCHEQKREIVFDYIEAEYNRQRRHSTPGHISPEAYGAGMNA
jgi:hypothetical protein